MTVPGAEADAARGSTLSDRLAAGIVGLVEAGRLGPGDPLPTVRDLASRFGVTPPTVREALRQLQATGAVELRHGSGVYVGAGLRRMVLANPHAGELAPERALELVEARLVLEPGIAAQAAQRHGEQDLVRLRAALETAAASARSSAPAAVAQLNFHRELAAASGNEVLFEVMDSLLAARSREQREVRRLLTDRRRDFEQHAGIVEAVAAGDAALAEALTREHLSEIRQAIAERVGKS